MRTLSILASLLLLCPLAILAGESQTPQRAEDIEYPISYWAPPNPGNYRQVVSDFVPLYIARATDLERMSVELILKIPKETHPFLSITMGRAMVRGGPSQMDLTEYRKTLGVSGARFDVFTERGCLVIGLSSKPENFPEAFKLLAATLKSPHFAAEELALMKAEFTLRSRRNEVNREWRETQTLFEKASLDSVGVASVRMAKSIDTQALKDLYQKLFVLERIALSASGPMKESEVVSIVEDGLKGLASTKEQPPRWELPRADGGGKIHVIEEGGRQAHCLAGFAAPPFGTQDHAAFSVAFRILAERIREKILSRRIGETCPAPAQFAGPDGREFHLFRVNRLPGTAADILLLLIEEAQSLAQISPGPEEIRKAVDALKRAKALDFVSLKVRARFFAVTECSRGPEGWPSGVYGGLLAISGEKVKTTAASFLNSGALVCVVSGPAESLKRALGTSGLKAKGITIEESAFFSPLGDGK
jgi:hypothetical protein